MKFTLPEFLAYAIAMEDEAANRYLELADMMETYEKDEVSSLFRDMNHYSILHRDSIKERVGSIELPTIRSWEYRWALPSEVGDEEGFDRNMDPYLALEYARDNERRAMEFYQSVAEGAEDPELKTLAAEFAAEEQEHTDALEGLLDKTLRRKNEL